MEIWVRGFVRHFEVLWNRHCRMPDKLWRARRGYNLIRSARDFIRELARQENWCFGNPEIRRPFLGFIYAAHQCSVLFRRKSAVESGAQVRIHVTITAGLYQKLPFAHYLLAVEPDIEIATDAVDVRFGSPVRASVFGIGMTKRDVYTGKLFVL